MKGLGLISFVVAISFSASAAAGESLLQQTAQEIASPNIAIDLGMSRTQISDRDKLFSEFQAKREAIGAKVNGKEDQAAALNDQMSKLLADLDGKLLALLTEHQKNRLLQIAIQEHGSEALLDDTVAKQVGLTSGQRAKVASILEKVSQALDDYQSEVGEALAKLPDPASDSKQAQDMYATKQRLIVESLSPQKKIYENVKASGNKQVYGLLTPVQRKKWDSMHGKPVMKGA